MEEQVPLVVSHTFRVVSEEADMTGEGGREGGREGGKEEEHIGDSRGEKGWRKRGRKTEEERDESSCTEGPNV